MKLTHCFSGLLVLLSLSTSLSAEVIEVQPGQNQLSAAVEAAADGDTLILAGGQYREDNAVNIDKILTIKGANRDNRPELIDISIRIARTESRSWGNLTFQNLFFNDGFITDAGVFNIYRQISFIENVFRNHGFDMGDTFNGFAISPQLIIVANQFSFFNDLTLVNDTHMFINARDLLVFAGNDISVSIFDEDTPSGGHDPVIDIRAVGNQYDQQCHVLGNRMSSPLYRGGATFIEWRCKGGVIAGNEFVMSKRYMPADFTNFNVTDTYRPFALQIRQNDTGIDIKNNIFKLTAVEGSRYATSDVTNVTNRAIFLDDRNSVTGELVKIENNVFDWSANANIETPVTDSSMIQYTPTSGAPTIRNNVFYGVDNYNLVAANLVDELDSADHFNTNLCFGDAVSGCTEENISADPDFVDGTTYVPGEDSPLINAGVEGNNYLDLDGTRNDIGIYGGHTPLNQYLDQLAVSNQNNPLIYPLRPASEGLTTNGNLQVRVLSVARSQ